MCTTIIISSGRTPRNGILCKPIYKTDTYFRSNHGITLQGELIQQRCPGEVVRVHTTEDSHRHPFPYATQKMCFLLVTKSTFPDLITEPGAGDNHRLNSSFQDGFYSYSAGEVVVRCIQITELSRRETV